MSTETTPGRADRTREQLIDAAIEVFGRDGYHAASNRALAERAGVNQALISYHFGGKEGLYLAVFDYIADRFAERLAPLAAEIDRELAALDADGGDARAVSVACIERLLLAQAEITSRAETAAWAKLIAREQQEPTAAFDRLYAGMLGRMTGLVSRLVGIALGEPGDSSRARLLALTLFGQVVFFRVARATVMSCMQWSSFGERELAAVQQQIRSNVRALLGVTANE